MAETLVENKVCAACGADVRENALFCYHCGGAISPEVAVAGNGDAVSSGWFRENIAEDKVKVETAEQPKTTAKLEVSALENFDKPIEKPTDEILGEPIAKPTGKLNEKPPEKPETKLKSAAAMRRRTKIVQKKKVEEVVWEEHESAPNIWFLLVALILILLAGGLFFLAIYVK
jgi:hypothetical protein